MSMTEKLAYIKKLRHLTTEEIARHSGVPVGTLNKIFSGQTRHPTAEPMARLAQSLRVPIRYLLDDALPLECYISLNGSDGPILLSDEEIRLLMRLRELEPRSRRAMGIMAELLGTPAPCLAGGIATRHLFCFLAAGSEAENPAWGVLRPRPVLIPEPDAAAREADFAVLLPDGSLEPLYSAGAVLLCRRERTLPRQGYALFLLNGAPLLRRLYRRSGASKLVAPNVDFKAIPVGDGDCLEYIGTIIGQAKHCRWE
ncbi:MAG TPA: XRE family transcriptional regulator [Candidatus Oscillibacter excrementavium]|nr:XRE family transcriptional regulator [Candidatus Oscillibacter excrementavium]